VKLKQYFIGFYRFWYKFIIGDEWTLAAALMWSLLAVYSATKNYFGDWYLLPVLIAFLLIFSLKRAAVNHKQKEIKNNPSPNSSLNYLILWALMVLVVIVPYDIFYIKGGVFNLSDVLLPTAINFGIIILIGLVTAPLLRHRSMLGTLLAGTATLALIKLNQQHIISITRKLAVSSITLGWLVFAACTIFVIAAVYYEILALSKRKLLISIFCSFCAGFK
jgi:Ca2+/Na+ antiporter